MAVAHLAAAVAIKQEPPDSPITSLESTSAEGHMHPVEPKPVHPVELDERIMNLCSQYPKGITDDIITQDQPQINTEQRLKALQRLLSQACVYVIYFRNVVGPGWRPIIIVIEINVFVSYYIIKSYDLKKVHMYVML